MGVSLVDLAETAEHLRVALDIDQAVIPPAVAADCALPFPGIAIHAFGLCAAQELHEIVLSGVHLSGVVEVIIAPDPWRLPGR